MPARELKVVVLGEDRLSPTLRQAAGATSSFGSRLEGLRTRLSDIGSRMRDVGAKMTIGVTAPLALLGVRAQKAASDTSESLNKVRVVFGSFASGIDRFAATSARSLGISRQAALSAAGTFGNLFTALGLGQREAAELSPQVVRLASDLASFHNIAPEEALEKLRSGLVGEIEPLRALGISFNAAQVEAKALEMGLGGANGEISESAKVQARLALVMEQSTAAQGDFARTADGAANRQRIAAAKMQDSLARLGTALVPIAQQVFGFLGALADRFSALGPGAQKMVLILGGVLAAVGPLVTVGGALVAVFGAVLSPVGAVVAALVLLGAGAVLAYQRFEGFRSAVGAVVSWLQTTAWPAIQAVASYIAARFGDLVGWVRLHWGQIREAVTNVVNVVSQVVRMVLGLLSVWWQAWGDDLLRIARSIWGLIAATIQNVLAIVRNVIVFVLALINGDWSRAWNALMGVLGAVWAQIQAVVGAAIGVVRSIIGGGLSWIGAIWSAAWGAVRNTTAGVLGTIRGIVAGAVDGIAGVWGRIRDVFLAPLRAVRGPVNTFLRGVNWVLDRLPGIEFRVPLIPEFHAGGIVGERGGPKEQLAVLQRGEGVLPVKAMRRLGRGGFTQLLEAETDVAPETGGLLETVRDLVRRIPGVDQVIDAVRGVIAKTVRPAANAATRVATDVMARFGVPGQLAGGTVRRAVDLGLDWIAGAEEGLKAAAPPPMSSAGPAMGGGWRALVDFMGRSGVAHRVTSTVRRGAITASGNVSRHARGLAADFAGPSASRDSPALGRIFAAFRPIEARLAELIYAGPQTSYNIKGGRRVGKYATAIHHDHVHAALEGGGVFSSPWSGLVDLAEHGTEIVTPEALIRQIVRDESRPPTPPPPLVIEHLEVHGTNLTAAQVIEELEWSLRREGLVPHG